MILNGTVIDQDTTIRCWDFQHEVSTYQTPFTPTSRSIWYDLSGNNNHATLAGVARPIPKYNYLDERVLNFDGSGSYAIVNQNILSDISGTISMWVNPKSQPVGSYYLFAAFGANSNRFYINYIANGFYVVRGNPFTAINSPSIPLLNKWSNIILTWNSSSFSGYLNGISFGTTVLNTTGSTTNFTIGGYTTPLGSAVFEGGISNVQIYNRNLSQQELLQNYNATKTRFGLT
jgi:hypothetical protein